VDIVVRSYYSKRDVEEGFGNVFHGEGFEFVSELNLSPIFDAAPAMGAQLPVGGQPHLKGSAAVEGGAGVGKTADSVTPFAAVEGGATLPPPTLNCAPSKQATN
jgi:hypothetical protein